MPAIIIPCADPERQGAPCAEEAGRALEQACRDPHLRDAVLSIAGIIATLDWLDCGAPLRRGRRCWRPAYGAKHTCEQSHRDAGRRVYVGTSELIAAALWRQLPVRWPARPGDRCWIRLPPSSQHAAKRGPVAQAGRDSGERMSACGALTLCKPGGRA